MRFLGLASWQVWLITAVAAATVTLFYLLKQRHRTILVPSSLIWDRVLRKRSPQSWIERLRWLVSLLLALCIALLLAVSSGQPVTGVTNENRLVVLLDSSPTMGTLRLDGKSRWDHAIAIAGDLLNEGQYREFLVTSTSDVATREWTSDREAALVRLRGMEWPTSSGRFPQVAGLDATVYFISDGVAIWDVPRRIRIISVFEPADNVGITAFEIRPHLLSRAPEGYLEISNYSLEPQDVRIRISGVGGKRETWSRRMNAGAVLTEDIPLTNYRSGGIRVSIEPGKDSFSADNTAYGYIREPIGVLLVTDGNSYLEDLLRLDPTVEASVCAPSEYRETNADVYVFDRFAPRSAPSKPCLVFRPADCWCRGPGGCKHRRSQNGTNHIR